MKNEKKNESDKIRTIQVWRIKHEEKAAEKNSIQFSCAAARINSNLLLGNCNTLNSLCLLLVGDSQSSDCCSLCTLHIESCWICLSVGIYFYPLLMYKKTFAIQKSHIASH